MRVAAVGSDHPQFAGLAESAGVVVVAPDEGDARAVGRPRGRLLEPVEVRELDLVGSVSVHSIQVAVGGSAAEERQRRTVG